MAINITYWLRKPPQPTAVLADEKKIEVGKNGRAWRDLTATITALEPSKLTALDGQGQVLRSIVLEADDKPPPSAEMTDLQFFGKLLSEAYDKGSKSTQPAIDAAMQFVQHQSTRLSAAEREIDRLRGVIHKQHMQIAELSGAAAPAGGEEDSLIGALVAGAMQQAAQPPPLTSGNGNGNGNGKAAKK